ncbi:MAG: UPF0236 family transposase-like protein [Bacilli bacterium]
MYSIPQTNTDLKRDSRKFKIYNIEFRFEEFAKVLARQAITECLESIDNQYFESKRWKSTHKNHGFKERTLITSLGVIRFRRRYYVALNKSKGYENYFFVDRFCDIGKYSRLTAGAMLRLTQMAVEVNASFAAKHALTDVEISRQTVSNLLKSFKPIIHDIPRTEEMIERCNLAKETVYIELDEAHCNLQEKQFQGKRKKNALANLGLLHTGHSPDTLRSKRKELENKRYFGGLNVDTGSFCDRIYGYILKRFKTSDLKRIFVSGDGAKWINNFASILRDCFRAEDIDVIQVLDKFHLRKRLTTIFSGDSQMINFFFDNLGELDAGKFKLIANNFYQKRPNHKCSPEVFRSHVKYICDNFKFIKNQLHPEYKTSCSMEGHVSHVLASRLTSRPKAFNRASLEALIQLTIMRANLHELTAEDIIEWRKPVPEEAKQVRSKSAYKMHKRFYDFNVDLKVMESSNAKMKDFIHKIVSPKWLYS